MATSKINRVFIVSLLLLTGCFSRSSAMTYNTYDSLKTGATVAELTAEAGKPYAIHVKEGGKEEYEYIERIDNGTALVAENHYYIVVQDGEVVGKYMKRELPPAYDLIYQEEPNYPGYPN